MSAPIVESQGLSKWFGEVVALNNLDLSIEPGVTGLLGPNGAGKSTFIKLMLGLYRPSRGWVRVLGEPPRNNPRILRRIGYCPEKDAFYGNMTGFEFVSLLNRYWGMPEKAAAKAAQEACETVRMVHRMHDPIDEYSKGMCQRIKLAQAIATRPELLFFDEPMAGLDPRGREEMFALIGWLGEAGYSVIVSSHILHEIERITDNVVLLYQGSMIAQGRVREIRALIDEHPHTVTVESSVPREVARHFVGDPSILGIDFSDGTLVLRTRDANRCYEALNRIALENGADVRTIGCADDNLQAVFDYLVQK